jgi:hypothetical protein
MLSLGSCLSIKIALYDSNNNNSNSVALVRDRTIPTERPQHVGEVSANFCGYRVSRGQHGGSIRP